MLHPEHDDVTKLQGPKALPICSFTSETFLSQIGQVGLIPYVEDGECVESHATSSSRAKPRRQPQAAPRQERPRVDDREGTVI
ncbi:hypothetical protein E4U09_005958 [Claviceps aff. purpurea]|uniref:Uncharacterized protein n=1 Tax=Claviceps aff. purpurea TaxID=1967640 RepID=A0A9P7U1B1_9HYPO|nr:hypothetical protein E4U09_005958 [Claviceps aff. purpurea]